MPWTVIKANDLKTPSRPWKIIRADTGKVVGSSKTKAMAQASVRARYANTKNEL